MHFILSTSQVRSKLLSELRSHFQTPKDITYSKASKLPYLSACIDEGMRLHFILGTGMPRSIPAKGATICGRHFPGNKGVKVLANMPVMQQSKEIFVEDAATFRPERWIERDDKTLATMHKYFHPWGIGVRTCQGRFIAMMEMYKFIAEMTMKWNFKLVESGSEGGGKMTLNRAYVQQPTGLMVRVQRETST
jgi:cytochrome P450